MTEHIGDRKQVEFDALTPDELRKEADRRELVNKHRRLADRRWARNQVAEAILAIPADTVAMADAAQMLRGLVRDLVAAEKAEAHVTNGDVSRVLFGVPLNWWQDAVADHPTLSEDDALERFERGRRLPW